MSHKKEERRKLSNQKEYKKSKSKEIGNCFYDLDSVISYENHNMTTPWFIYDLLSVFMVLCN